MHLNAYALVHKHFPRNPQAMQQTKCIFYSMCNCKLWTVPGHKNWNGNKYSFTRKNNLFLVMKINTRNYQQTNESEIIIHPRRVWGIIYIVDVLRSLDTVVGCLFAPRRVMTMLWSFCNTVSDILINTTRITNLWKCHPAMNIYVYGIDWYQKILTLPMICKRFYYLRCKYFILS